MPRPLAVCLYCGSSNLAPPGHLALAAAFGRALAERGMTLIYGGGRVGLMGAAAEAAKLAGGRVVGIIPQFLLRLEVGHGGLDELVVTQTMHERKRLMAERADVFCVLPGGLGTLDETFEIVTWAQLGLHAKPVLLLNHQGFWDPLLILVERLVANRYMRAEQRSLLQPVADLEALMARLATLPVDDGEERLERT